MKLIFQKTPQAAVSFLVYANNLKQFLAVFFFTLILWVPPAVFAQDKDMYRDYMRMGERAVAAKDYFLAYDYFAHAYLINPESQEALHYLKKLEELNLRRQGKGRASYEVGTEGYPEIYRDYMRMGKKALRENDFNKAQGFFEFASLVMPTSDEPTFYINLTKRLQEKKVQRKPSVMPDTQKEQRAPAVKEGQREVPHPQTQPRLQPQPSRQRAISQALDRYETLDSGRDLIPEASEVKSSDRRQPPVASPSRRRADSIASARVLPTALPPVLTKQFTQIEYSDVLKGETELYLNDAVRATQPSTLVRIELNSALVVKGRNIDRHLMISPGVIEIERIDRDQIQINALRRGITLLHIWDDQGRWTFNVEVILPLQTAEAVIEEQKSTEYAEPFNFSYSADWNSFYLGQALDDVHRSSLSFLQRYAVYGSTPYGDFDAFGAYNRLLQSNELTRYGLGLTDGKIGNFEDFTIRGYDISKELSPLTLPGQFFRGLLFESDAFDHNLHYDYVRGQARHSFGFAPVGTSDLREDFVEGGKVTLFPEEENQYSFNFVRGYGDEREATLKDEAYSIQLQRRINPVLVSTESAFDREDFAHTIQTKFGDNQLKGAVNLRSIDEGYTTISHPPGNQGEVGGTSTFNWSSDRADVSTFLDVYQEHLFANPDNGDQLNFDFNTTASLPITDTLGWRPAFYYLNTPGELAPRENLRALSNFTHRYSLGQGKELTTTVGGAYQQSRFELSPLSEYDRYSLNAGVRYSLLVDLNYFANYEYSWVDEILSGDRLMPSVFTTGLNYFRAFNKKLSGNLGFTYRDEENAEGINSFLAGEDSTTGTVGLVFSPKDDVEFFWDGRVRNVWREKSESTSYNEVDVRLGMRSLWDLPFTWNPSGIIAGYVFKDLNNNKTMDVGESGIKDVRIRIGEQEAYTDTTGRYEAFVRAKKVYVSVDSSSVPQGFIFSTPTITQVDIKTVKDREFNFGLTTESGVYGIVYYDQNQNGKPDGDDKFIPRVKITLDGTEETMTDFEGTYLFQDIGEGSHEILMDVNSLPPEYLPTIKIKNTIEVKEGVTYVFHIPVRLTTEDHRP